MEAAGEKVPLFHRFTPLSEPRTSSSSGSSSPTERHWLLKEARYGSVTLEDNGATMGQDGGPDGDGRVEEPVETRPLTFWPLLALIFYTASGGPFGIEVRIRRVPSLTCVPPESLMGCV